MKDLIILGNGMAGMTAALYAKRANLDFKIIGRDEYDFGQISNAVFVENFPCMEPMSGFDLAMKLHDQLEANGIEIEEHEIIKVSKQLGKSITKGHVPIFYKIEYTDGTSDEAKAVIYALGAKHRELNCAIDPEVPIHYCALCDGALYKDKTVAIIGGGDVAFTQAEYLSNICKNVMIIMCDENITASSSITERVKNISNIDIYFNTPIDKICKDRDGKINICSTYVEKQPFGEDIIKKRTFVFEDLGVFVAIGMIPNTTPIDIYDVVNKDGYITALDTGISMLNPGFFAAGDCRTKITRQALTAASDGANAVNSAIIYLRGTNNENNNPMDK